MKIWSLPKHENVTTGKKYCEKEEKLLRSNFSSFPQYFQYISNFILYIFVKCGCSNYFSSVLQIWYVEVRISRSISESPLEFEITRVDCTTKSPAISLGYFWGKIKNPAHIRHGRYSSEVKSRHHSLALFPLSSNDWRTRRNFAFLTIQNTPRDDSDQTARVRRLIWIFAMRTCPKGCHHENIPI